ncbi:MAG: hypothetical protein J6C76_03250 [Oscillospiraceae bacterium]|nr:hypothetical protein [Oscillospiraceae bacterium]
MNNTHKISLCGVFGALSIVIMLMGSIIPMATYMCPAIAAFFILPIVAEYGEKTGFTLYAAVSLLCMMLIAEKEFVLMYVFVFGFYSVFKFRADKIKPKFVQFVLKALYAFITTFISYALLLLVFPSPVLTNDFSDMTTGIVIAFFVLFVITFMLYDFAAKIMFVLYNSRLRPRIMKKR